MAELTPFRMDGGSGPGRNLHPGAKLVALLLLAASAMRSGALICAGMGGVAFLAGVARSAERRIACRELLSGARFLIPLALLIVLVRTLDFGGPQGQAWGLNVAGTVAAVLYVLRLVTVYFLAELFFQTTSTKELGDWATANARRLGFKNIDPGLYLTLAVDFLPRSFEAYRRTMEAAQVRGFGVKGRMRRRRTLKRGIQAISWILESFLEHALRGAVRTARGLESRCYDPTRTVGTHRLRAWDAVLLGLSALPLAVSLLLW